MTIVIASTHMHIMMQLPQILVPGCAHDYLLHLYLNLPVQLLHTMATTVMHQQHVHLTLTLILPLNPPTS